MMRRLRSWIVSNIIIYESWLGGGGGRAFGFVLLMAFDDFLVLMGYLASLFPVRVHSSSQISAFI